MGLWNPTSRITLKPSQFSHRKIKLPHNPKTSQKTLHLFPNITRILDEPVGTKHHSPHHLPSTQPSGPLRTRPPSPSQTYRHGRKGGWVILKVNLLPVGQGVNGVNTIPLKESNNLQSQQKNYLERSKNTLGTSLGQISGIENYWLA